MSLSDFEKLLYTTECTAGMLFEGEGKRQGARGVERDIIEEGVKGERGGRMD